MNNKDIFDKIKSFKEQREALDFLFDTVDDMLLDGKFEEVNELLKKAPLNEFSTTIQIGFVSITYAAKEKLPAYSLTLEIIRKNFLEAGFEKSRIQSLLQGFDK